MVSPPLFAKLNVIPGMRPCADAVVIIVDVMDEMVIGALTLAI